MVNLVANSMLAAESTHQAPPTDLPTDRGATLESLVKSKAIKTRFVPGGMVMHVDEVQRDLVARLLGVNVVALQLYATTKDRSRVVRGFVGQVVDIVWLLADSPSGHKAMPDVEWRLPVDLESIGELSIVAFSKNGAQVIWSTEFPTEQQAGQN